MPQATLQQVRRGVQTALDDGGVYTLAASTSSVASSNGVADLTANASTGRFDGAWVYSCSTGQQRRVQTGGFAPFTGALTLNYTWGAPAVGSEIEITRLLPCVGAVPSEDASYLGIIRKAAAKLLVPDRITLPITTDDTYSLAAYPFLDRPERLVRLLEPPAVGTRTIDASWRGPRLVWSSGTLTLELDAPFDVASGSLTLEVSRPAGSLISGVETDTASTTQIFDTAWFPCSAEDLVLLATMEALYSLMSRNPGRPGQWDARYSEAKERAEQLYHFDGAFYRPKSATPVVAA